MGDVLIEEKDILSAGTVYGILYLRVACIVAKAIFDGARLGPDVIKTDEAIVGVEALSTVSPHRSVTRGVDDKGILGNRRQDLIDEGNLT